MKVTGRIFKLPPDHRDDVNTDVIIAGRHLRVPEDELARHAFENVMPDFHEQIEGHSILVAGRNMGCGSSREQAPKALLGCGIRLVIAESFGNIFYRNAVNLGLGVLVLPDPSALDRLEGGREATVDLASGVVEIDGGPTLEAQPVAEHVMRILSAGGLLPLLKKDPDALL
ncbi:MAG: 3-isopropylmalate dehydratase [Alphaproteobacteria bacterium]